MRGPSERINRITTNLIGAIELLALELTQYEQLARSERRHINGWPPTNSDPKVTTHTTTSTTEAAAINRLTIDQRLQGYYDELNAAVLTISNLRRDLQHELRRHGAPTPPPPEQCDGRGLDGYHHWGNPTCTLPAVKAGLCNTCYMRSYRWRRDNNRPPLTSTK